MSDIILGSTSRGALESCLGHEKVIEDYSRLGGQLPPEGIIQEGEKGLDLEYKYVKNETAIIFKVKIKTAVEKIDLIHCVCKN